MENWIACRKRLVAYRLVMNLQLLLNGVTNGVLFSLLAASYGLIYRSTQVFHVAFGALFVVSGYLLAGIAKRGVNWGPEIIGWFILVMLVSAVFGVIVERVYWGLHCRGRGSGAIMVASLGLTTIIESLVAWINGNDVVSVKVKNISAQPMFSSAQQWEMSVSALLLLGIACGFLWFRPLKFIWAMGDEPELLSILGRRRGFYRSVVFGLGTALAALPACFITVDAGITPHVGMHYLLIAVIGMLAGGRDRFWGWVAGGFLLSIVNNLVLSFLAAQWMDPIAFGILLIGMFLWPRGVFGLQQRTEEA